MPTVRTATESDLPAICALGAEVNAIHHDAHPELFAGRGAAHRDLPHWWSALTGPDSVVFVAEESGRVVAFVNVRMVNESRTWLQPLCFGLVGTLSVAQDRRGQGIGPELMRRVHTWVKERHGREVRLQVSGFNQHALHVYQELGYEIRSLNLAKVVVDKP
jgi:ribosomal protein S18 acetylase RimI-like enzyme